MTLIKHMFQVRRKLSSLPPSVGALAAGHRDTTSVYILLYNAGTKMRLTTDLSTTSCQLKYVIIIYYKYTGLYIEPDTLYTPSHTNTHMLNWKIYYFYCFSCVYQYFILNFYDYCWCASENILNERDMQRYVDTYYISNFNKLFFP